MGSSDATGSDADADQPAGATSPTDRGCGPGVWRALMWELMGLVPRELEPPSP